MKEISRVAINKANTKNKSKLIKRNILLNGKKEFKLLPKLIPKFSLKLILKIVNQKLIKFLNG